MSEELQHEIEALRAQVAALSRTVEELQQHRAPRGAALLDRRRLLRLAPLAAAAAVGVTVAAPQSASAAPPDGEFEDLTAVRLDVSDKSGFHGPTTFEETMSYAPLAGGMENPGDVTIGGQLGTDAQVIIRSGADAVSVQDGLRLDTTGNGIDISSFGAALTATTRNTLMTADSALIDNHGRGRGILVRSLNAANVNGAVTGTNQGSGAGLWGSSSKGDAVVGVATKGRGGRFTGSAANVRLVPGKGATHPAGGQAGDLYVDKSNRLWFCTKTSVRTAGWKRLA
jgi:hypothetical protein